MKACKLENEVPYEANATRTWVERYVLTKDGAFHADSPKGGRDGYTTPDLDLNESGSSPSIPRRSTRRTSCPSSATSATIRPACRSARSAPPTRRPTASSSSTGSGASAAATASWPAPTGPGSSTPSYHTAEKCTFCYHRISEGLPSACVQACPFGARQIGNLQDPDDPVTRAISTERVGVLKSEFGTKPQVYYVGLDWEVR